MKVIFDKDKLGEILKDFNTITNATISVWDADFNQIMYYPKKMKCLCHAIKTNPNGKQKCFNSDIDAFMKSSLQEKPYTFTCHAGLVDTAIPVYYEDEVIAYIMFGQIRDKEESLSNVEDVIELCKKYNMNEETVRKYYAELPVLTREQIDASAKFLKMVTIHLHLSQTIKIEKNKLVSDIDSYITENITSPISIDDICDEFNITKNYLYEISHSFFNTTIKDYIIIKRLELAKHYLTTTRIPISEVSTKSGFSDYNYFIRIFKKRIGYTPLVFRKKFPLEVI